jgi:hypothetical protein
MGFKSVGTFGERQRKKTPESFEEVGAALSSLTAMRAPLSASPVSALLTEPVIVRLF